MSGRPSAAPSSLRRVTEDDVAAQVAVGLVSAGVRFARRNYVTTALYLVGLTVASLASGFAVPQKRAVAFNQALSRVDLRTVEVLEDRLADDYQRYYQSKGWFFQCDAECTARHAQYKATEADLERAHDRNRAALSAARAEVGVFSEYAVGDARELFWETLRGATEFAKRMSYTDALILAINSMHRDETLFSVVVRWFFQVALNFTVGMLTAFFAFAYHVARLAFSYQPNPLGGAAFVVLALAGAGSILASVVVGMYVATAAASYVTFKLIGPKLRIEQGAQGRRIRAHHE